MTPIEKGAVETRRSGWGQWVAVEAAFSGCQAGLVAAWWLELIMRSGKMVA